MNCLMGLRLVKEGVQIRECVNNVNSDIFVDTSAKYTIIDFAFWRKVNIGQDMVNTCICLVGPRG